VLSLVVRSVMPDDVQSDHAKTQSTGDIVSVVQVVSATSSQHPGSGPSCPGHGPYSPLRRATSDNRQGATSLSASEGRRSARPPTSLHRPKSPTSGAAARSSPAVTFNTPDVAATAAAVNTSVMVAAPVMVELPSSVGDHGFSARARPKSLSTSPQTVESLA